MENLIKAGRAFYVIGIAGIGVQQFIYADFRPVLLPEWPSWIRGHPTWAYLAGAALIVAASLILLGIRARMTSLILGVAFLLLFMVFQVTYQLFINPYS